MNQVFSVLFFVGAHGLKDPVLKIKEVRCTQGIDSLCASQCTANQCYGAQNLRDLNKCLMAMHTGCSIDLTSELTVTLQQDIDFCDKPTDGTLPDGWLLNIPYMGKWQDMTNPTVSLPTGHESSMGKEACDDLMREIAYRPSPGVATIDRNICINSVRHDADATLKAIRLIGVPGNVFPISVNDGINSMLISPTLRSCWSPNLRHIDFSIEFKERLMGQSQLDLSKIVVSGTLPMNQLEPRVVPSPVHIPTLITAALPEEHMESQVASADEAEI